MTVDLIYNCIRMFIIWQMLCFICAVCKQCPVCPQCFSFVHQWMATGVFGRIGTDVTSPVLTVHVRAHVHAQIPHPPTVALTALDPELKAWSVCLVRAHVRHGPLNAFVYEFMLQMCRDI